eukprot:scaffold7099_cov131-Isochrysis_galbana.AAC.12
MSPSLVQLHGLVDLTDRARTALLYKAASMPATASHIVTWRIEEELRRDCAGAADGLAVKRTICVMCLFLYLLHVKRSVLAGA